METLRNSVSPESGKLRDWLKRIHDARGATISAGLRQKLKDEILDVYSERRIAGWDGYNADPITNEFCGAAIKFVDLLPQCIAEPDVVAEPTGRIGFEWVVGRYKRLSISAANSSIEYAMIIGSRKRFGEEPFFDEIPNEIEKLLLDHFSKI